MKQCNKGAEKKNTLSQCRALIATYLVKNDDELEMDLDACIGGLSETTKLPG